MKTPGGDSIVTADGLGTLRTWDLTRGQLIATAESPHGSGINCLAATRIARQSLVLSGGTDGLVRFWDPSTLNEVDIPWDPEVGVISSITVGKAGHSPAVLVWGCTKEQLAVGIVLCQEQRAASTKCFSQLISLEGVSRVFRL